MAQVTEDVKGESSNTFKQEDFKKMIDSGRHGGNVGVPQNNSFNFNFSDNNAPI